MDMANTLFTFTFTKGHDKLLQMKGYIKALSAYT